MDPSWVMWKDFWLESFNVTQLGNLEGFLVELFLLDPGWGIRKESWLEFLERPPAGGIRRICGWKA